MRTGFTYWHVAFVPLLLTVSIVADGQPATPTVITNHSPVLYAALQLEYYSGTPVTFEPPLLRWRAEMQRIGVLPDGMEILVPSVHSLTMPAEAKIFRDALDAAVIAKVLDAYSAANPIRPRFRAIQSTMGFHIVPISAHDEAGVIQETQSVLDAEVTVDTGMRTASGHLNALLAAVSEATRVRTVSDHPIEVPYAANGYLIPFNRTPDMTDAPRMSFEWGTGGRVKARDALIDLLKGSATTMTWKMICRPDFDHGDQPGCFLNVGPLAAKGRTMAFDRCTKCQSAPGR